MPNPPFRAEHIGSLLRPAGLLDMRRRFARGEVDHAALTQAEDRAIEDAVRLQERVGLASRPMASSGAAPITAISTVAWATLRRTR